MAILDLDVGSAANANDGATLRDAFINVRKMMYEIYGVSTNASDVLDSYTDTLNLATGSQTFKESVQDIVGGMFTGNTETNITATYEDSDGTIDLVVTADLDSIVAGDGLTGTSLTSGDPTLNVVGGDGITSNTDEIEVTVDNSTIELSATDGSGAVRIKDLGVTTAKLAADAVTGAKIADDAINSEHYTDGSIDTAHIADLQVTTAKLAADAVTNAKIADDSIDSEHYVDGSIDTAHIGDDQVTPAKISIIDDSVAATSAHILIGDGTDFGNVAVSGDIAIASNGATTIQADSVEHSMIENRYTAVGTITNTSGATSVDWSAAAVYKMNSALTGGIEFDFTGFKAGQVLTIYNISGSQTITLDSDASTSEAFLKVGGVDYDGSATSILQVECLADGADAVFAYSVAQYASDPTP